MRDDLDRAYYLRRITEEEERARSACDPGIARIHRDLLREYEAKLAKLPPMPGSFAAA